MRISDWSSDLCSSDLMADPDAHAPEIVADMRDHAADAIMPRRAAALLDLYLHRREVEFVVKGGDVLRRQLVEIHRGAHAAAAFVHEGRGFEQQHALAADARSEEHTSELQSLMRISYAVFCLKKKK